MRLLIMVLIGIVSGNVAVAQETPGPPAGPPAVAPPKAQPFRLSIEKASSETEARMLAVPRVEEHVEVRDRYQQQAQEAYLRAEDLGCAATAGPPTQDEMNRFREARIPPDADLLAGGKLVGRTVKGLVRRPKPRFLLYSARRQDAPDTVVYVMRDGRISEGVHSSIPGTAWELVDSFADREKAAAAVTRLQRGLASTSRERNGTSRSAPRRCSRRVPPNTSVKLTQSTHGTIGTWPSQVTPGVGPTVASAWPI